MTRPAARIVVISVAGFVAGWPALAHAQRVGPVAPPVEAQQRHDPQHADHTTLEQPPSQATDQTADAPTAQGTTQPRTPIPPITDADRAAAFPDVEGDTVHDNAVHAFVLFDQLEWQGVETGGGLSWDTKGWIGGDRDRLWFRAEGGAADGQLGDAEAHLFYGRAFARWWDVVVGVRQDVRPGSAQTWIAFGVQGLAPYWFEVEATGYVSDGGQTAVRLEAEYELLLTNRLVVQPLIEVNVYGKSNVARGIGAGLSDTDIGLRLRYEFRWEVAPYIGVTWRNAFGETRDLAQAAGDTIGGARFVAGVRLWY